jgi:hypothetical protein
MFTFRRNPTPTAVAFVGVQLLLALRHPATLRNLALGPVCLTNGAVAGCGGAPGPSVWQWHGGRMQVATDVGDGVVLEGAEPIITLQHEMGALTVIESESSWDAAYFVWACGSVIISMYLLAAEQHFWRPVCAVLSLNFWCVAAWLSCAVSPAIGAVLVATAVASRRSMLLFPAPSGELSVRLPSALPWQCGPTA